MLMTELSVGYGVLTVGCCRPWRSLLFMIVAVVGTVGDRPCFIFFFVMIVFVVCDHPRIL